MPGVYFFEDENKEPLYIGKSINIKSRIRQHFEGFTTKTTKAAHFIPQTKTLYFKVLNNDIQAVITEANYIKTHSPKYNAITKDNKSNLYLIFTNPPDIKITLARATDINSYNLDNYSLQVFGPYTSSQIARTLLKHIRKTFGYCLRPFNSQKKPCFNYHLEQCPGACCGKITEKEYNRRIGTIKKFLSGQFNLIKKSLNTQIKKLIKSENFEEAAKVKQQYFSLDYILGTGNVSLLLKLSESTPSTQNKIVSTLNHPLLNNTPRRIECYDLAHLQGKNYVGAMSVMVDGHLSKADYRHFHIQEGTSDPFAMKEIVKRRFNHTEWPMPDLIVLDGGKPQLGIVSTVIPENIAVVALAKKQETLYYYDKNKKIVELSLSLEDPVLNQFRTIRDEAHRFGNSFHRKQRQKSLLI